MRVKKRNTRYLFHRGELLYAREFEKRGGCGSEEHYQPVASPHYSVSEKTRVVSWTGYQSVALDSVKNR